MTSRAEYLALAERAERAERADRDLDAAIMEALGHSVRRDRQYRRQRAWCWLRDRRWVPLPDLTASRDAAASLTPEDWHVTVRGLNDSWHVEMNTTRAPTPERPARTVTAFCGDEARARTAAALRARAEEAKDGN